MSINSFNVIDSPGYTMVADMFDADFMQAELYWKRARLHLQDPSAR